MQHDNSRGMRHLAVGLLVVEAVLAGVSSSLAAEAVPAPVPAQDRNVSAQNPCSAYFKKFPDSRAQALLECQNEATSKAPTHLTGEEASKIYDAYMAKMSKEREDVADKRD